MSSNVSYISTLQEYNKLVTNANNTNKLLVLLFYMNGCGPCEAFKPMFEEISRNFNNKVLFGAINLASNSQDIANIKKTYIESLHFNNQAINDFPGVPTVFFIYNTKILKETFTGGNSGNNVISYINNFTH